MNPNHNAPQGSPSTTAAPQQSQEFAYQIGLWGTANSGKTTYLTMLFSALNRSPSAVIRPDERGREFYLRNSEFIFESGRFPPKTGATQQTEYPTLEYALYPPATNDDPNRVPIKLTFLDAPGEFYEDIEGRAIVRKDHTIIDYLCECDGIIFLLDPVRAKNAGRSYRSLIENLLFRLAAATQSRSNDPNRTPLIESYMAFCVSKIDVPEYWDKHKEKPELIEKVVGSYVLDLLAHQFCYPGRFEFFTLSAIGRQPGIQGGDDSQPNVAPNEDLTGSSPGGRASHPPDGPGAQAAQRPLSERFNNSESADAAASSTPPEKILNKDKISPIGVVEPLSWLISGIYQNPPKILRKGRNRS